MSYDRFVQRNIIRCQHPAGFNHPLNSWSLSDWMTATVGELGEAANVIKKLNRIRDGIANRKGETEEDLLAKLREEMADAFTYMILLAAAARFDLLEAAEEKFSILSAEIGYSEPSAAEGNIGPTYGDC